MSATIVVTPNRWNAKADRDGRFTIRDVPPGRYTIVAWHKAAGYFRQPVEIAAGRDAAIEFLDSDRRGWLEADFEATRDARRRGTVNAFPYARIPALFRSLCASSDGKFLGYSETGAVDGAGRPALVAARES